MLRSSSMTQRNNRMNEQQRPLLQEEDPHGENSDSNLIDVSQSTNLERKNDQLVDGLRSKVTALKDLTVNIGHEVRYQNEMLDNMNNQTDSTLGFLTNTSRKLTRLRNAPYAKNMCYLFLFVVAVFFLILIIRKLR